MNIVLFGGSFDPIHLGHVNIARRAAEVLHAVVYFIPAKVGVWKTDSVSKEHKLAMLKLAIKNYPELKISEYELESKEPINYSVDTALYFKEQFPDANLFFLIGGDQACQFHKWKHAEELSQVASIIYYPRDGFNPTEDNIQKYGMRELGGKYYDISSTDIRSMNSLYLPREVIDYVLENNLYFVPHLKNLYNRKRYNHAISVARTAVDIAEANHVLFGYNYGVVFSAALLHDIGKDMPKNEQFEIMQTCYPEYASLPQFAHHAFAGAELAKRIFNIDDEFILDAIKYHATGRENMTVLEKIIYAADKIEPTRGYDSSNLINAMKEDIDKGFVMVLKANKEYLLKSGKNIHNELTDLCFKFYQID